MMVSRSTEFGPCGSMSTTARRCRDAQDMRPQRRREPKSSRAATAMVRKALMVVPPRFVYDSIGQIVPRRSRLSSDHLSTLVAKLTTTDSSLYRSVTIGRSR